MKFESPKIMGILNVTPDSFSDGGKYNKIKNLKLKIKNFIEDDVNIIDIGGESTGPGSKSVSLEEEMNRVKPVIDYVASEVAKGTAQVMLEAGVPVLFGVLTTESIEQAIERAGSKAGNKGSDVAVAALEMINLVDKL